MYFLAVSLCEDTPGSDILCAQPKFKFSFAVDPSVGGVTVFKIPYLNVLGSHTYVLTRPAFWCLVLPSRPIVFVYGAPATTKFSSVLIDKDSPSLLVLSSLSVIVAVACIEYSVPAVWLDLNRKCTSP